MRGNVAAFTLTALCLAGATGCKVQVNQGATGEGKDVKIASPLGGVNVETNRTSAQDLGLPLYPGAQVDRDEGDGKSASVELGFGSWQLHVKVASYESSDPQDKVLAFYRDALHMYGDVIECQGNKPVGAPVTTSEGLSCNDSGPSHRNAHIGEDDLLLKAGSRDRQHIVAFKDGGGSTTRFALVALELPRPSGNGKQETN